MSLFDKQGYGIAPSPWGVHPVRYYATTLRAMGLQVPTPLLNKIKIHTTLFYKFKVTPFKF